MFIYTAISYITSVFTVNNGNEQTCSIEYPLGPKKLLLNWESLLLDTMQQQAGIHYKIL